jgi:hypothetical protein
MRSNFTVGRASFGQVTEEATKARIVLTVAAIDDRYAEVVLSRQ